MLSAAEVVWGGRDIAKSGFQTKGKKKKMSKATWQSSVLARRRYRFSLVVVVELVGLVGVTTCGVLFR